MIERVGNRLTVRAPMTIANARALLEQGDALAAEVGDADALLVDLGQVREADSAALAILFAWQRGRLARGGSLRVENAPAGVVSLAAMYGVADLIALNPAA